MSTWRRCQRCLHWAKLRFEMPETLALSVNSCSQCRDRIFAQTVPVTRMGRKQQKHRNKVFADRANHSLVCECYSVNCNFAQYKIVGKSTHIKGRKPLSFAFAQRSRATLRCRVPTHNTRASRSASAILFSSNAMTLFDWPYKNQARWERPCCWPCAHGMNRFFVAYIISYTAISKKIFKLTIAQRPPAVCLVSGIS